MPSREHLQGCPYRGQRRCLYRIGEKAKLFGTKEDRLGAIRR